MSLLYAIVDVETTGTRPGVEAITEIGIVITDSKKILSSWSTLVNPGQPIPANISALTGITNEMVRQAPHFEQLAGEVYTLLKDKIFVAHHVKFDYSFIKYALADRGYPWETEKICTAQLFRRLYPDEKASLSWICKKLNIENSRPHRALPDALATAKVFLKLLEYYRDTYGCDFSPKKKSYISDYDISADLPNTTGVYYLRDEHDKILYVGKASNIRKRVAQHLLDSEKSRFTIRASFTETHSQWLALLLEDSEIQRLWPPLNKAQRHPPRSWGIISYSDARQNTRFAIDTIRKGQSALAYFSSYVQAQDFLLRLMHDFSLNPSCCGAASSESKASDADHNAAASKAIKYLQTLQKFRENFTGWLLLSDHQWSGNIFLCFLHAHLIGYVITADDMPAVGQLKSLKPGVNSPYILRSLFSQASPSDFIYDPTIEQAHEYQAYPLLRFC